VSTAVLSEILGPDLLVILVIVLVLFGGSRLPKLARSVGSARREFERGLSDGDGDATPVQHEEQASPSAPRTLTKDEVDRMLRGTSD
jgi:sec-independent protein translocase protein TatA